jgi:hypothetical protein
MHCTRTRSPLAATFAIALATTFTLWAATAWAQTLVLSNLVVDNQAGSLMARFGVAVDGVAEMTDNLQNGVTLSLVCKARLNKSGSLFNGHQLAETQMTSKLKYDALTKEYSLQLPGREAPLKHPRLDELLRAGWGSLSLDMGPWRMLERGQDYTLALDIKLSQADMPNWLRRNLFFWSWDVIPNSSYQLQFKY